MVEVVLVVVVVVGVVVVNVVVEVVVVGVVFGVVVVVVVLKFFIIFRHYLVLNVQGYSYLSQFLFIIVPLWKRMLDHTYIVISLLPLEPIFTSHSP